MLRLHRSPWYRHEYQVDFVYTWAVTTGPPVQVQGSVTHDSYQLWLEWLLLADLADRYAQFDRKLCG